MIELLEPVHVNLRHFTRSNAVILTISFRPEDVHSVTKCPLRYESPLRYNMKTCSISLFLLPTMTISQNQIKLIHPFVTKLNLFVSTNMLRIKAILKIEISQKLQNIRVKNHIIENVTDISRLF